MKRFTTVEIDVSLAIDILHDALDSYRTRGKGYKAIEQALAETAAALAKGVRAARI